MTNRKKKLSEQVVVITGASSGIGLCTAQMAAARGARVVLAARSGDDLEQIVRGIRDNGGHAISVVADVGDRLAVERIAQEALRAFGRIDTWVNNAGSSSYGFASEVPLEDMRRVFETDFWGTVHGCLTAIPHLAKEHGTLINIGSVVSDKGVPMQAAYSAAKHAVRGFTDALRMELFAKPETASISVCLIKPAGIDTPFFQHAANHMDKEPNPTPPVYAPEVVAEAILALAERPQRELTVGGGGRAPLVLGQLAPALFEYLFGPRLTTMQKRQRPANPRTEALHRASERAEDATGPHAHGGHPGMVRQTSYYTSAMTHPKTSMATVALVGAGLAVGATAIWRANTASPPA